MKIVTDLSLTSASCRPNHSWQPTVLFRGGEQGVLFTPSQGAALFSDPEGTVTAQFGGSVALMNDASGNGVNAVQATASARPIYGRVPATGRRNLLESSEDISSSPWSYIIATPESHSDVLGYPVTKVVITSYGSNVNYAGRVQQTHDLSVGVYTWTSIVSSNIDDEVILLVTATGGSEVGGSIGTRAVIFDTSTETFSLNGLGPNNNVSASYLGDNLWKLVLTFEVTAAGTVHLQLPVSRQYVVGVSEGEYILAGPQQLEVGASATDYQRVGSTYDVTEDGVRSLAYLFDDGVDDKLEATLPDLGTDATVAYASDQGVTIQTGQTIGAGAFDVLRDEKLFGMVVIDRALTTAETARLTAWLNHKAGDYA